MSTSNSADRQTTVRAPLRRLARSAYRAVLGVPPKRDRGRAWPGTATDDEEPLRLLHVGDCGFRRMDFGHDLTAPPGYPLAAAEELRREGVGMAFGHYFAIAYADLPDMERLRRHMHLDGQPDVVVVQLGGSPARKVVLPHRAAIHRLRADAGRRLGRHIYLAHRVMRQWVRIAGRYPCEHGGLEHLERFLMQVTEAWPLARVVVIPPFPRSHNYRRQLEISRRIDADVKAAAARSGVGVLDAGPALGDDPSLRCANAYNLNAAGSTLVGGLLADWILQRGERSAAGSLSAARSG
jgi:hypothetical protein